MKSKVMFNFEELKIGIIGLGYVGLPLAVEFAEKWDVIAFDINDVRIQELKKGLDKTREVDFLKLKDNERLRFTNDEEKLSTCNFFIITVPTPMTMKSGLIYFHLGPQHILSQNIKKKILLSLNLRSELRKSACPFWRMGQAFTLTWTFSVGTVQKGLILATRSIPSETL